MNKNTTDYDTIQAMKKYGGGFVKSLAVCAEHADPTNLQKIKSTFVEYWAEYQKIGEMQAEKNDNDTQEGFNEGRGK